MPDVDYINMDKGDKLARHKEEFNRYKYDGDYRPASYTNTSTYHKIRINDMEVKASLGKLIDQAVLLSKSTIWNTTMVAFDKLMRKYHDLPEEEQERDIPDEYIEFTKQVAKNLKSQAISYESRQAHPKPPQLINDENDKTTTVLDTDYFKEVKSDVKIDFPYQSIAEIYKDKSLSTAEKSNMCDQYLLMKSENTEQEGTLEVIEGYGGLMILETDDDDDDDDDIIPQIDIPKTTKTPKEMFLILCEKYPKRFVKAKKGKSPRIGWLKTIKGIDYTPTLITVNPQESKDYENKCLYDSTIRHKADAYFVKGLNAYMYFIRTTKE